MNTGMTMSLRTVGMEPLLRFTALPEKEIGWQTAVGAREIAQAAGSATSWAKAARIFSVLLGIGAAACVSEPGNLEQPRAQIDGGQNTRQDGGQEQFSCVVDQRIVIEEGAVDVADPSRIEVHDGDTEKETVGNRTTRYRSSAIDAAELAVCIDGWGWLDQYGVGPDTGINYGQLGKQYFDTAIHTAHSVQRIMGEGTTDGSGRTLTYHVVYRGNGAELLECLMVREGLAYETVSYYGLGSHPRLAQLVLDAAEYAGQPHFEQPYLYKRNARRRC